MFRTLPIRVGGDPITTDHPFKVSTIKVGKIWKRGVTFNSKLFNSLSYMDTKTITGLLTESSPSSDDAGWATTRDGDSIWLELEFTTAGWPTISTAKIKSKKVDNDFAAGEVEHDGGVGTPKVYTQKKARIVLATIAITDGAITVNQIVTSNLRMALSAIGGKASESDTNPVVIAASYPYAV
jgi:hypothetical protein